MSIMLSLGGFPVYHVLIERVPCLSCSCWEGSQLIMLLLGGFPVDHALVWRVPYMCAMFLLGGFLVYCVLLEGFPVYQVLVEKIPYISCYY